MNVYEIVFLLLFVGFMLLSVGLVMSGLKGVRTAKAGKVSKHCPRLVFYDRSDNGTISVGGLTIDVSKMLHLVVFGNSMKDYDIWDGQEIYAKRISEEEKRKITDYPVLVFQITNAKFYDSQFKLRKFVNYGKIDNAEVEWAAIYDKDRNRIKINKEDFVQKCRIKAKKLNAFGISGDVALSETYDEEANCYDYSLHPVNTIYAVVKYAA